MGAQEHLSQMQFPGMPPRGALPPQPSTISPSPLDAEYPDDGAHKSLRWGKSEPLDTRNPIYSERTWSDWSTHVDREIASGKYDTHESPEFIPPWRVGSIQGHVNPEAIEHQVQHADPLALREDPSVVPYDVGEEEHYMVLDGNHRVNAAQRRGQLLMPANVERWHH